MIGMVIPNSYGQTEEITIDVKTESSEYYLHEKILLEGKVSKIIPNTPITWVVVTEDNVPFKKTKWKDKMNNERYQSSDNQHFWLLKDLILSDTGEFNIQLKFFENSISPDQKLTVKFFYGYANDNFASTEIPFYLHNENNQIYNKLKSYFPTERIKLGIDEKAHDYDWHANELVDTNTGDFVAAMRYNDGYASIRYFENGEYGINEMMCLEGTMNEPEISEQYEMCSDILILNSSNTPTIPEDFICMKRDNGHIWKSAWFDFRFYITECINETLLVKVWDEQSAVDYEDWVDPELSLIAKLILENIEANPISKETTSSIIESDAIYNYNPTHIENFPDETKSPQHYLDRYNNEESYKEWFDTQFPNNTIYEILDLTEPKKPKIPSWVKDTMQWYLDGVISEDEMITAIQYLVKEGIIDIN